jgi:hypothetical protein
MLMFIVHLQSDTNTYLQELLKLKQNKTKNTENDDIKQLELPRTSDGEKISISTLQNFLCASIEAEHLYNSALPL